MTSNIELTSYEQMAIGMLQSNPQEFQKIARNGQIDLNEVLRWYERLTDHLQWSKVKRRNEYIDVESRIIDIAKETA